MTGVRRHLRTNLGPWLVALAALAVACTTSAWAVVHINGADIRRHSIPGDRLARNSVTGGAIHNHTIGAADLLATAADFTRVDQTVGTHDQDITALYPSYTTIATHSMPAGSWLVLSHVLATTAGTGVVECRLSVDGTGIAETQETDQGGTVELVLFGVRDQASAGTLTLGCNHTVSINTSATIPQVDLVRVGDVTATGNPLYP